MTENEMRGKVVAQAWEWYNEGLRESDGSHMRVIEVYNAIRPLPRGYKMTATDPWCAAFVSAVGAACGLTDIILPECACDPMITTYKAAGRWMEADDYEAQPGDMIFYDWQDSGVGDCVGSSDHVGVIVQYDGYFYTVVEGNKSDMVALRTIAHNGRYIRGFAVPDYAGRAAVAEIPTGAEDVGTPGAASPTEDHFRDATKMTCTVSLPVLRYGDGLDDPREDVRAAQCLLLLRGFRCGAAGCDGEYGHMTKAAVERFQRGYNLAADGIVGPETWAALIRISK